MNIENLYNSIRDISSCASQFITLTQEDIINYINNAYSYNLNDEDTFLTSVGGILNLYYASSSFETYGVFNVEYLKDTNIYDESILETISYLNSSIIQRIFCGISNISYHDETLDKQKKELSNYLENSQSPSNYKPNTFTYIYDYISNLYNNPSAFCNKSYFNEILNNIGEDFFCYILGEGNLKFFKFNFDGNIHVTVPEIKGGFEYPFPKLKFVKTLDQHDNYIDSFNSEEIDTGYNIYMNNVISRNKLIRIYIYCNILGIKSPIHIGSDWGIPIIFNVEHEYPELFVSYSQELERYKSLINRFNKIYQKYSGTHEDEDYIVDECIDKMLDNIDVFFDVENKTNWGKYLNESKTIFPTFNKLNEKTQEFIPMGLYLYDSINKLNKRHNKETIDYAPFILQYCKALECELLQKIFEDFKDKFNSHDIQFEEESYYKNTDIAIKNAIRFLNKKFVPFIKQNKNIELGGMYLILFYMMGMTPDKKYISTFKGLNKIETIPSNEYSSYSLLIIEFKKFLENFFKQSELKSIFSEIKLEEIRNYRNHSAHASNKLQTIDDANNLKNMIENALKIIS